MTISRRSVLMAALAPRRPRILLRGSWQSVNIGDIGHTPGALALLRRYFPEALVTLWPGELGHGSRELLTREFPELTIAEGAVGPGGRPSTAALEKAWAEADLYLSGSGSGFPASNHAIAFQKATGKPVGVFAVSNDPISGFGAGREPEGGTLEELRAKALRLPKDHLAPGLRALMDHCAFFFCRDTITLSYLKAQGVKTPVLEFGPDSQLGMPLRDDERGLRWLKEHGLEAGRYLCVVPRLRYTPYYKIRGTVRNEEDAAKDAINDRTVVADHAPLRELMIAYVRKTGRKVVACPEMTYQIELAKQQLVDPLPEDVRAKVVWRDTYWLPDEAAAVYARANAVVSIECHSPLIALRNGTPAFHVRQPTDTCKGQMYRDFGAGAWLYEVGAARGEALWQRLEPLVRDEARAKREVAAVLAQVDAGQKKMVAAARAACGV